MTPLPSSMRGIAMTRIKVTIPAPIWLVSLALPINSPPTENDQEIERAIDDIIKYSPLKIYKKVQANFAPEPAVT